MLLGHEKEYLLHLPTPLEYLPSVSADLGIELYIKRDDLTPLAMGGNKLRKLEYLLKDALNKDSTLLLTVGGIQTNHGRLTCAAARKYGLKGAIAAVGDYPDEISANLLLDGMMGSDVWIRKPEEGRSEDELLDETVKKVTAQYEADGEKVWEDPMNWELLDITNAHWKSHHRSGEPISRDAAWFQLLAAWVHTWVCSAPFITKIFLCILREYQYFSMTT